MADETVKKLLIKLGISTADWKTAINEIRSQLNAVNDKAKADAGILLQTQKDQLGVTKQQIAEQQRLAAEAKALSAADQAKVQWQKQQQELLNTKIKQTLLETAEAKKQEMLKQSALKLEQMELSTAEKKVALLQRQEELTRKRVSEEQVEEVNMFKVGTIKAAAGFQPFQAPAAGLTTEKQLASIAEEKQRLVMLDAQTRILESQGKYRRIDLDYVRQLITAEKAKATISEAQVRQEQIKLKLLEQESIAASKLANPANVSALKQTVGFQTFSPAQQGASLEVQEATLVKERQRLSAIESELRLQSTQSTVRKADIEAVEKELVVEKARVASAQTLLNIQLQTVRTESKQVNTQEVNQLKNVLGFRASQVQQPKGMMDRLFGPSTEQQLQSITKEKEKLTTMQMQLKVIADQNTYRKVDLQQVTQDIRAEQNKLSLLERELVTKREEVVAGRGEEKGGVLGETVNKLTGGGVFGNIAAGMFTGFAGVAIFTGIIDQIHELGKALIEASGPAEQLRQQFEHLAESSGKDPAEFLTKLRVATRGLVTDLDLFRMSNNLLRQGLDVTDAQLTHMVSNTVELARSMGKSSTEVSRSLELAFLNPQRGMMALARTTGIQVQVLRQSMEGIPASVSPAARATVMFNTVLNEEDKMLQRVGKPMTTLPELIQQVSNVEKNFLEGIAEGITHTGSFAEAIEQMSQRLIAFMPTLDRLSLSIGDKLGKAIEWVVNHLHELKIAAEGLAGLKLVSMLAGLTGGFSAWGTAIAFVAKQLGLVQLAQEGLSTVGLTKIGIGATETLAGGATAGEGAGLIGGVAGVTAAAPVAGALALGGGLQFAALKEQGLTIKQAKEGISELITETKEASVSVSEIVKSSISAANSIVSVWAIKLGPEWAELWTGVKDKSAEAFEGVQNTVLKVFSTIIENSPFGIIAKQLKDLSDAAETRRMKEHPASLDIKRGTQTTTPFVPTPQPHKQTPDELAETIADMKRIAQLKMQETELENKLLLDTVKQRITQEEQLLQQEYDTNLISLEQYVSKEKKYKDEEYQATLTQISKDKQAQLENLKTQDSVTIEGVTLQLKTHQEQAYARQKIEESTNLKIVDATTKHNTDIYNLNRKQISDQEAAYRLYEEDISKVQSQGVQERITILQKEFDLGNVNVSSYIEQRKELVQEEYQITVDGLNKKREVTQKNSKEEAEINLALIQASIAREKQLTSITVSEDDIRLKSLEAHYDKAKKYLDIQKSLVTGTGQANEIQQQEAVATMLFDMTQKHIEQLQQMRVGLDPASEAWGKITEDIGQATEEQKNLNLELIKARDTAEPLATIFGSLAGVFGQFKTKGAQGISELLTNMSGSMEKLSQFSVAMGQSQGNLFGNLRSSFTALFSTKSAGVSPEVKQTAQQLFDEGLTKSSTAMTDLSRSSLETAQSIKQLGEAAAEALNKLIGKEVQELPAARQGAPFAGYEDGTDYVPETGLALLHEGEAVVPKSKTNIIRDKVTNVVKSLSSKVSSVANVIGGTDEDIKDPILQMLRLYGANISGDVKETGPASVQKGDYVVPKEASQGGLFNNFINYLYPNATNKLGTDRINLGTHDISPAEYAGMMKGAASLTSSEREMIFNAIFPQIHPSSTQQDKQAQSKISSGSLSKPGMMVLQATQMYRDMVASQSTEMPSYQVGGEVEDTGPALLHEGETVVPKDKVSIYARTVQGLKEKVTKTVQQLQSKVSSLAGTVSGQVPHISLDTSDISPMTGPGMMFTAMKMIGLQGNAPASTVQGQYGVINPIEQLPALYQSTASFVNAINPNFLQTLMAAMASPPGSKQRKNLSTQAQQYIGDINSSGFDASSFMQWINQGPVVTAQPLQSFQTGGVITQSGAIQAEEGEGIVSSPLMAMLNTFSGKGSTTSMGGQMDSVMSSFSNIIQSLVGKLNGLATATGTATQNLLNLKAPEGLGTTSDTVPFSTSDLTAPAVLKDTTSTSTPSTTGSSVNSSQGNALSTGIFGKLTSSMEALFQSTSKAADGTNSFGSKLADFSKNLSGVISGVSGLIQGVTSGKTGAQGAVSGGMAGLQFGAQVGGPIGAAVGLAAGGIMGGIFGSKTKQLNEDIHKIQTQMQSIVSDMQAGTISLSQAIADLRQERQQAIALLSQDPKSGKGGGKGGKKGFSPSQMQSVIEQIDSQIQALVNQQTVILQSLNTSLMEVSNPLQYQDYLQTLDQIIQKYQEFASAAQGNVTEMANANQYLNDSLQQYVTTLSQNLNQAQQSAIQDALTLINLEYQRQQIINQEAQQEYDVLTQGVLTRQRTTAMTKGQEIGQLQYQRDMQLDQINEQISLEQYKVAAETKIFNLATTRIGLETQLLEAQEDAANYQILQIQALAQVVSALQSGLSTGALTATLQNMESGALPTESGIMWTLLQMLGLAGNVPPGALGTPSTGITNWLATVPAQYASAAQYVASLDPNFPSMIASGDWSDAEADVQQYESQGEVEGYDMTGLLSWLQSNPPIPQQQYQSGGEVTQTGSAIVHAGEQVISAADVASIVDSSDSPSAMLSILGSIGGPIGQAFTAAMNAIAPFTAAASPTIAAVSTSDTNLPVTVSSTYGSSIGPGPITRSGQPVGPQPSGTPSTVGTSVLVQAHQTLYDLTAKRASMEMTVISARNTQMQGEMSLIASWNDLLTSIQNAGSGTTGMPGLEDMLQEVYERRGRYGSGNFRREQL